jgi:hypothetical protein
MRYEIRELRTKIGGEAKATLSRRDKSFIRRIDRIEMDRTGWERRHFPTIVWIFKAQKAD